MNTKVKNFLVWPLVVFFALGVGLYPLVYVFTDMSNNLLGTKTAELLQNTFWNVSFYTHIFVGGVALFIGWLQFVKRLREKNIRIHRMIGYVYTVSVLLSGFAGLFISFSATGPWHTKLGFFLLAVMWLLTTFMAIRSIRNKNITSHQYWMMRSYALTLSAVTLRLWLPFFSIVLGWTFLESYKIIAWLAWVPNLFFMELYICGKINAKETKK